MEDKQTRWVGAELPLDVHERLGKIAKFNHRSLTKEIIHVLTQHSHSATPERTQEEDGA